MWYIAAGKAYLALPARPEAPTYKCPHRSPYFSLRDDVLSRLRGMVETCSLGLWRAESGGSRRPWLAARPDQGGACKPAHAVFQAVAPFC